MNRFCANVVTVAFWPLVGVTLGALLVAAAVEDKIAITGIIAAALAGWTAGRIVWGWDID